MASAASRSARTSESSLREALLSLHRGDFGVRLRPGRGLDRGVAAAFNALAERQEQLATELTRLAGAVGRHGELAARASLAGAPGGWTACVEAVNSVVGELVRPMSEVGRVIDAVAQGDLGRKMPTEMDGRPMKGEFLRTARTVNRMVEQLNAFASEVTRVAREVGTEGKLGGQAQVKGVAGTWRDLTHSVNSMAANLTSQVRNIAEVTTAVARGDLSKKITVDVKGEIRELKDTINTMVDQLSTLASEVTRVAREVGTEGKLGGQARVKGVAGTWKDLTENVNSMAANLTSQVRNIADVTTAVARGDLSKKITVDVKGEILELKDTINTMVDQLSTFASEVTRVAREVGTEGKLGGQARVKGVAGTWEDLTDNVNSMAANLTSQVRNIAEVTTAVARGDLSKKITVDVKGEIRELKDTINTMVDQLKGFASEVTRVAREVGTEGKLGGQAEVKGVAGTWKDLTDNVNSMAANLTSQVRNIAEVTTAVANGDLSRKITVDVKGEILELKDTINTMVDQLKGFASEVTRVAREVGTEGKLGGQAEVEGVAGTWKDLTDNVNSMAANLTSQVRNIAEVTTAVANGDLSRKITVDVKGEILELKDTINTMVDQLKGFASEVTRVAREVGTDGKLGGQAEVEGVAGTWKDLTDNVNSMAANLTSQVRNIAHVTTAVANGDLSKKITVDVKGEILELKNTINTMVDQLKGFASEVTRVAREVGTEGKLGGQARVEGVAGTWKDLTDNVNSMAANLTSQVRNIAHVTTAVANGDLSKKITVDVKGEILELKDTINTMVEQLKGFASEVTRVAREVGTEGKLGGQARVEGVAGTWKDLTDNVNSMAENLTSQVRNIADVTTAVARGDLSKKVTVEVKGEILELKDTINTMVDQLNAFASEVTRVAKEVGTDGRLGGQAYVRGVAGTWKDLTDSVNSMADNLTSQVRNIAEVTTAVANGDLSRKITVDVKGEILELKNTINTMVDQLNAFASEVTRVAREVGTEGNLGGQALVRGVAGVWKDLTDNVNTMAENLTSQVRGIARVVTAVANGDLKQNLVLEAKGEIAILADTINEMIDTLAVFAEQVSGVAREVGVEGQLGGQAQVPGAAGTWRDLTDNVNGLAANLTTQVRAIAEVATAVTEGDLTRSIAVEARGEVAALKDNINEMIRNLKETTQKNTRQDWLNSNLARFGRMLQGQRDLQAVSRMVLSELASLVSAQLGAFYVLEGGKEDPRLELRAAYAPSSRLADEGVAGSFRVGEGLVGQCALEREKILLERVPPGYVRISSGLGEAAPATLSVLPVLFEGQVKAVVELASFGAFSDTHLAFLDQLMESLGIVLNTIETTMQTEELLRQSQLLTERLRAQQEELQKTNEQLEEKARLLTEQKAQVEIKNREVELASQALEEKATQLSLASKYKSEFLANMSHELRTPLNSLLILAKLMADDPEGNLTPKQIEFAETIHSSGRDLLALINEILDLSKIESGTMAVDVGDVPLADLAEFAERGFRQVADDKRLGFEVALEPGLGKSIRTDSRRLQQVLRNLLSNAFKFTERGGVTLRIGRAESGWNPAHEVLASAAEVFSFSVEDTGIGIPADKQGIIFEAFQQADGTTSRRFGGTGLGLSISREIARILGGAIRLDSTPGKGSTFTLFLPAVYNGSAGAAHRVSPATAGTRASAFSTTTSPLGDGVVVTSAANGVPALPAASAPALSTASSVSTAVETAPAPEPLDDDRTRIRQGDAVVLVVDEDPVRASQILELVRDRKMKGVVAPRREWAVSLARLYRPRGIVIAGPASNQDASLDRLWHDPMTRRSPCHVIDEGSGVRNPFLLGLRTYVSKPVTGEALRDALVRVRAHRDGRALSTALVAASDDTERRRIVDSLSAGGLRLTEARTGRDAVAAMQAERPDLIVVDLTMPRLGAEDILSAARRDPLQRETAAILCAAPWMTTDESERVRALADRSSGDTSREKREGTLSETVAFLRRVEATLSDTRTKPSHAASDTEATLAGKKVLVVDDDVRNVFAITSMLEHQDMQVRYATSGHDAVQSLERDPAVDVVLMDIMMPGMDGYETIKAIRRVSRFATLPIIALTAKAMAGDRERCLEAGASDYVTKPVESDQLLSLLRVWLSN